MKNVNRLTVILLSIGLTALMALPGCKKDNLTREDATGIKDLNSFPANEVICENMNLMAATITPEEEEMLMHMREEEKLARDVYQNLFEEYHMKIFDNISQSEQTHMDQVLCLLLNFGLEDPASSEIGVFNNAELQQIYNDLMDLGLTSRLKALITGATIEDLDINDLDEYIDEAENQDIINVFSSLCCGSRNHLRSFNDQLIKRGYTYTPQYIEEAYFKALEDEAETVSRMLHGLIKSLKAKT